MKKLRVLALYSNYYNLGMYTTETDIREWRDDINKETCYGGKGDR